MKRLSLFIILAVIALLAAACGGGGEAESADSGPALVRQTVMALDSFEYDPPSMTVPEGANVTIELVNEGALEHSWVLVANDVAPAEATDEDAINGATSGNVAGGDSSRFSFEAPATGTYQIICTVPGHAVGGMVGTFIVE